MKLIKSVKSIKLPRLNRLTFKDIQAILGGLFVLAFMLFCVVQVFIKPARTNQRYRQAVDEFGADIVDLCLDPQTPPASYPVEVGEHPRLLVLDLGKPGWHPWNNDLPAERRAETRDELDVLICAHDRQDGEQVSVEMCQYRGGGWAGVSYRYRYDVTVLALDPETGALIREDVLTGETPRECPESRSVRKGQRLSDIHGGLPTASFLNWVEENLP